jgi:bifunctional enzyme CysN/CysC
VDIDTLEERAAESVPPEGFAEIVLTAPGFILFDPFTPGGTSGRGVLIDQHQKVVGGAPLIGPVDLSQDLVFPIDSAVTLQERARANGHRGAVFWLTGLPGAGKSTLARTVERMLFQTAVDAVVLDGDTLRAGLNSDLGFSERDRAENNRRAATVARILADAGHVVLVSLISPRAEDRARAQAVVGSAFHEIYVRADAKTCEARDPKGLWAASRAGRLHGFTGVDAPYDIPANPALVVDTQTGSLAYCVDALVDYVRAVVLPGCP